MPAGLSAENMDKNGANRLEVGNEGLVVCQNSHGAEVAGTLLRLTRYQVVFEIYTPDTVLRASEVLTGFKVTINDRPVYSGRAVVANLLNTGTGSVCEARLDEPWLDAEANFPLQRPEQLRAGFDQFVRQWQRFYKIQPEYKSIVADVQTFLTDLRLWLGQLEMGIRSAASEPTLALERENEAAAELSSSTTPTITALFERFEWTAGQIEDDLKAAHGAFVKRQLHPLLLASPFLARTFYKPLGYAGDYEMVNMIMRDPREGASLFAKILNLWFLSQAPAVAHRNRIKYLTDRIGEIAVRAAATGRTARILSLGCGPAGEVQQFLRESHLANRVHFIMLDFNEQTLAHTRANLEQLKKKHNRSTTFDFIKKSVVQIFKEAARETIRTAEHQYEFVYCAGLFDYLSDAFCQRLSNILYDWVAPGGLFVSTNVDSSNPRRLTMEYVMEWNLIYRSGAQLAAVKPKAVPGGDYAVKSDLTGVNIYFEAWKPSRG
jgi:extracellular factor (EF) 3-hydroxypalmitic acid methyl ester biosynthesis protein